MSDPIIFPNNPVRLISVIRIAASKKDQFLEWNGDVANVLLTFPGFSSREIIPPHAEGIAEWVVIYRFDSLEHVNAWRGCNNYQTLLEELKLSIGGVTTELVGSAAAQYHIEHSVTQVIYEHVPPGMEAAYQEWSNRIQKAQSSSPGYQGGYSQPPKASGQGWMTLMRFSSIEHLNGWMNSPMRQTLLDEAKDLVATSYQHRLDTSFPGWAPIDPASKESPPNWKITMLVLLGLYPIVCMEILFLMKLLGEYGLSSALACFVGNAISVFLVGYATMPCLCRWLNWWLLPKLDAPKSIHLKGALLVVAFYAISVAIFWRFM